MPIYAYRCEACGHAQDHLQKMSDPVMTDCPACGAPAYKKQLTAAGFQLKGSGWYVTDFRNGADKSGASAPSPAASGDGKPTESAATATPAASPAPAPAASTPSAAPATAATSSTSSS